MTRHPDCYAARLTAVAAVLLMIAACKRHEAPAADASGSASVPAVRPLPDPLPDPVARVNGELVPLRNVKVLAEVLLGDGTFPKDHRAEAYRQALDRFVERELLLQEAIARGLTADQRRIEQAEDKLHAGYPDEASWREFLNKQGFDARSFKTELRVQYTVGALLARTVVSPDDVTDEQVAEYYRAHTAELAVPERYKVRHILIRLPLDVNPQRKGEFKTKAEKILVEARTGGDFNALAKANSEDEKTAATGGLIPPFGKGDLGPDFAAIETAAAALKIGQVSDVVETKAGYHIVKLEERLPGGTRTLEESAEAIRETVAKGRSAAARADLVRSLRAKAKIETFL